MALVRASFWVGSKFSKLEHSALGWRSGLPLRF